MKKVKNKIIALILVIPLLLMFSLSTAAKTVEVLVDVPVTEVNLTIDGEKEKNVDILVQTQVKLDVQILPTTATHTKTSFQAMAVEGKKKAEVEITDDGVVSAKSVGSVIIIATAGGKQDSVIINFGSEKVAEAEQVTTKIRMQAGDAGEITIGEDLLIYPTHGEYEISYQSSDSTIVSITQQGKMTAKFGGECQIMVRLVGVKYDESQKKFVDHTYEFIYQVEVEAVLTDDLISFDGGKSETTISSFSESESLVNLTVNESFSNIEALTFEYDSDAIDGVVIEKNKTNPKLYSLRITWKSSAANGDYVISIKYANETVGTVNIERGKVNWSINYSGDCFLALDKFKEIDITVEGIDNYNVLYRAKDSKIQVLKKSNDLFRVTAKAEGESEVIVTLIIDGVEYESKTLKVEVLKPYNDISIKNDESLKSINNSLAKELVLGGFKYENEELTAYSFSIPVNVSYKTGVIESVVDNSKLVWKTSNDRIATVNNGVISITGVESGVVTIMVESAYNKKLGFDVSATITIEVVKDAVNITNYDELMLSQKQEKEIVLQSDIMLAPLLKERYSDENWRKGGYKDYIEGKGEFSESVYKTMNPTADISYYKAMGKENDANLKYFVEFTNNVYGNGHFIDADYLTKGGEKMYSGTNAKGFIFTGPLSLVKISYYTESTAADNASIKSQDNIVFLVRKDDVKLRNVELKGCSDSSVGNDLTNLDYCGTVLEVVGDNFDLSYSKVNNGRTVVRVYGKGNANETDVKNNISDYKITTNIKNCILTYGREFILKIGTNQIKRGAVVADESVNLAEKKWYPNNNTNYKQYYDQANPYFLKADGSPYAVGESDDYFINNYVLTDVTLENCVFVSAGLFSVGLESQFGGLVLDGWNYSNNYRFGSDKGWGDVAGTSYPARLNLVGDVRFYDWKKITDINSDTLLEAGDLIKEKLHLNLNISDLIESFRVSGENEEIINKLILTSGGDNFVNGAVAMYGGGKNYSVINFDGVGEEFSELYALSIDVKYFAPSHPQLIYYSAGIEPFRFMIYQATSNDENYITYDRQQKDLSDNNAYIWVYRD